MRQGTQGWCTGMTLRDGMRREMEGVSGWGTHVHPWLIHVNVWQKPLQYCKVISLQLKINKLNKKYKIIGTTANRKRSISRCIFSPCLFNLYAEYIRRNAGLDEAQTGIKIAR